MKNAEKILRLKASESGKVLGPLEEDVMDVLWTQGVCHGKEVLNEITKKRPAAHTTVLTILERLAKKGLVRKDKETSGYVYTAVYTKEEFSDIVSKQLLKGVIAMSGDAVIANFVDIVADANPDELARLSTLIEVKRRELKKR